ncbi:hypothetical protein D041_4144B, partial [Vibrio parahaemolyticus EKP-008]
DFTILLSNFANAFRTSEGVLRFASLNNI